jgi:hypothetical protein
MDLFVGKNLTKAGHQRKDGAMRRPALGLAALVPNPDQAQLSRNGAAAGSQSGIVSFHSPFALLKGGGRT